MNANSCADCALTSSVNVLQLSQPPFQRKKEGHRQHRGRGAAVAGWRSYRRVELHRFGGLSGWRRQLAGGMGARETIQCQLDDQSKLAPNLPRPRKGSERDLRDDAGADGGDLRGSANLSAIAQLSTCKCRMRKAGGRQDKIHARKVAKRLADRHPVFVQKILLQLAHDKKRSGAREDARLARGRREESALPGKRKRIRPSAQFHFLQARMSRPINECPPLSRRFPWYGRAAADECLPRELCYRANTLPGSAHSTEWRARNAHTPVRRRVWTHRYA